MKLEVSESFVATEILSKAQTYKNFVWLTWKNTVSYTQVFIVLHFVLFLSLGYSLPGL